MSKKDKKKGDDKKSKKKVNDKLGYIPPDLCEWVSSRYVQEDLDTSIIDDNQKARFMKQINELRDRNERYSKQIDEATLNLTLYPPKFKKLESDSNDMTNYLNNNLEIKEKECENEMTILRKLQEEFQQQKERHEKELKAARDAFEDMQKRLLPVNEKLKQTLSENSSNQKTNLNMEASRAEYKKELETKALQHQAHLYEMEKENVRELFEIREQIPKWVKKVAHENMDMETGRMHRILNNYRLELGDLLKKYVGKPNQLARKAIDENDQLTKTVETNALNIKLILENTEAMMRNGDSDVHEMHDLASNVKENKVLLKSFISSDDLAPVVISGLDEKVMESEQLVKRLINYNENSKVEKNKIRSQIESLDEENFKLQAIIRSFQKVFSKLMVDCPQYEALLNNLRVASCLDISTEQVSTSHICCRLVDSYSIFQTTPIFRPVNQLE